MPTLRLDQLLLQRGLAPSREKARALVMAGRIRVDGQRVDKAGTRVGNTAVVDVAGPPHPYVSRGGVKLQAALAAFGVDPAGCLALDVGASTGGFTDCLLKHSARHVIALDVGHGQLDWSLRNNDRVTVIERFNARNLDPASLAKAASGRVTVDNIDLAVVDVSFISLSLILAALARLPRPRRAIALVKPQFEVGRGAVGKGGVVRDPDLHAAAVRTVAGAAGESGWEATGVCASPLTGADGNREFFLHLVRRPSPARTLTAGELEATIRLAVGGAP